LLDCPDVDLFDRISVGIVPPRQHETSEPESNASYRPQYEA
jgi:hypothetical protein